MTDDPQNLSFGSDAAGYDAGRLGYPPALYERLEAAGLAPGARLFEIGAGTGIATRRLLEAGPARLTAIEPDPRMAALLHERLGGAPALEIRVGPFEDTSLEPGAYDLGCAATAFHWCDPARASAAAAAALRSGGRLVLWWNIYRDLDGNDAFGEAIAPLIASVGDDEAALRRSLPDLPALAAALGAAGFRGVETAALAWSVTLDAAQNRALYASMSITRSLAAPARARLLDGIERLAAERFGGRVERRFRTAVLSAERP